VSWDKTKKPNEIRDGIRRIINSGYTCYYLVGFEVLTAVSAKMAVFWVVSPLSLVEVYQRFRGPCCLHHQGDESLIALTRLARGLLVNLMMEAARISETPENFNQTTRRYNPEDSHLCYYLVNLQLNLCRRFLLHS
jgi:hypothetical protein